MEYGRHVARLRRRHRRAYAPTSNAASHDNHEKINSWVSFCFHIWVAYGAPLGSPLGRQSSANMLRAFDHICMEKARYKFLIIIIIIVIVVVVVVVFIVIVIVIVIVIAIAITVTITVTVVIVNNYSPKWR